MVGLFLLLVKLFQENDMHTQPLGRIVFPILSSLVLAGLIVAILFFTVATAADETFWVDSSSDAGDVIPGDCVCATAGSSCTLRAAIQEANACAGGQTIRFNNGITMTISPATALPAIADDYTTIDGSDQWYDWSGAQAPGVVIDGASIIANGLAINASHCAVYGLEIINFGYHGIILYGNAQQNQIGGEGVNQRNVISHNTMNGVLIDSVNAIDNTVSGNYVGTNALGLDADYGNGWHGISVRNGADNTISGNLIADNGWSGAAIDAVSSGTIMNNHIGMDVDGNPLPNVYYGVHIATAANPQVIQNQIAFNKRGIQVEGGSQAYINGNNIYNNDVTSLGTPHGGGVMITGAGSYANLYQNNITSNVALFGGGIAVENGANSMVEDNNIQENQAYRTDHGDLGGGGIYVDNASITATYNTIISNTAIGPTTSPYAFPNGGGVLLYNAGEAWLTGNEIRGNGVSGNAGGGGGVKVNSGGEIHLNHNFIANNTSTTASSDGSGIDINTLMGATFVYIEGNRVEGNSSSDSAVFLFNSDYVSITNNLIVDNYDPGLIIMNSGDHNQSNFNTIAQNSGSGILLDDSHLDLYNTLVISNTGYGVEGSGSWSMVNTRNDVWGNGLGASNTGASFYLEVDPRFFNANAGAYALRPGSPCLDVGDYGHPVYTSYNDVARPIGAGYDLGAYEMPVPVWLPVLLR
jgi:parallel beta-helix repeat protein